MSDLWTAFTATWPIWLFVAAMTAYAMWACRASAGDHDYQSREDRP